MWTPFLCVITLLISLAFHVAAQTGFLSLDCGGAQSFTDTSGIEWVPDDEYITTGSVASVSSGSRFSSQYQTLRYFPGPKRKHCYELPVIPSSTYLVRPSFLYGNYDSRHYLPAFDLLVGATVFSSIHLEVLSSNDTWYSEFVVTALNDNLHFCLASTSASSVPFISALQLRLMGPGMYQTYEGNQALIMLGRMNVGATSSDDISYPDDDYDRIWLSDAQDNKYPTISTTSPVTSKSTRNQPPSSVMKTAITSNTSIVFTFDVLLNSTKSYYVSFYFAEFPTVSTRSLREFNIMRIEGLFYGPLNVRAYSGVLNTVEVFSNRLHGSTSFMFVPTTSSTLGPILNAAEIFEVLSNLTLETNRDDVSAINGIKSYFNLSGWSGDPCLPLPYTWDWVTCDVKHSPAIITGLNLSNFQLNGSIPQTISQLKHLTTILLDNNNLIGTIPDLSSLKNLTTLSLLNNKLMRECAPQRFRAGLTVNLSGNPTSSCSPKHQHPRTKIALAVAVSSTGVLLAVLLVAFLCCKRKATKLRTVDTHSRDSSDSSPHGDQVKPTTNVKRGVDRKNRATSDTRSSPSDDQEKSTTYVGRKNKAISKQVFQYEEILEATSAFQKKLGEGSFGPVYYGQLADGQEVAVKVHSKRSSQGRQEFNNEIDVLSVVHHKNLVSFLGYCSHDSALILIYEYLSNGTLGEHLYGKRRPPLSWKSRLNIALDAAQGLDYLHTACHPRIIHRDVKSSNILLTTALVAKVADFGLSKLYNKDDASHVSTVVKGTIGYLDPEYHSWGRLTEKSDVYSFGVVLFEIISGRPPISLMFPQEQVSLVKWACMQIHKGELASVGDSRLSNYNKESMWKVAEVAMECIDESGNRPTMNTVVNELKEAMKLEEGPLTDL